MRLANLSSSRLFQRVIGTERYAVKAAMSQDSSSRRSAATPSNASVISSSTPSSSTIYSSATSSSSSSWNLSNSNSSRSFLVAIRENAASAVKSLPRWTTPLISIVGGAVGFWLAGASVLIGVGSSLVTGVVVLSLRFGAGDKPDFLTPLFEECVEDVRKLLSVLEQKLQDEYRASKYPLFVNLMLLKLHQTREQNAAIVDACDSPRASIRPDIVESPSNVICIDPSPSSAVLDDDADAYLQYACSAYGTTMNPDLITTVYHPKTIIFNQEDVFDDSTRATPRADENWSQLISKRVIVEMTGLNDAAIKVVQLEGETALMPRYFVAVDENRRAVVLCIRGTLSLSDIMTDVCAECVPYKDLGFAHQGISVGAERLKEETLDVVNRLLGENPGYSLVVCGHSLGAGTASLLTMSLLNDQDNGDLPSPLQSTDIRAYCYAPPPTFGPLDNVPVRWNANIRSYINGADVVPKLSLSSVYRLLKDLLAIDRCDISLTERFQLIVKCLQKDDESFSRLESLVRVVSSRNANTNRDERDKDFPELFLIGKVFWINRNGGGKEEGDDATCEICRADQVEKDGIKILENFIGDHFPSSYRKNFKEVRDDFSVKY